jgi:hypothetical protein
MEAPQITNQPTPPGLIATLSAGFNILSANVYLLILPVLFDLALWLGPRLSIYAFLQPFLAQMQQLPSETTGITPEVLAIIDQVWQEFDLLAALNTFPIGIYSLLASESVLLSPLGARSVIEATSASGAFGWWAMLTLGGWLIGCAYFWLVSRAALGETGVSLTRALGQGLAMGAFFILAGLFIGTPALFLMGIWATVSPQTASLALLVLALIGLWFLVPIMFSAHGIFIHGKHALASLWHSFTLTRWAYSLGGLFVFTALLIALGFDFLWRIPPRDSWLTVLGILGHSVIVTALLAGSFVYYRDLSVWLDAWRARISN